MKAYVVLYNSFEKDEDSVVFLGVYPTLSEAVSEIITTEADDVEAPVPEFSRYTIVEASVEGDKIVYKSLNPVFFPDYAVEVKEYWCARPRLKDALNDLEELLKRVDSAYSKQLVKELKVLVGFARFDPVLARRVVEVASRNLENRFDVLLEII